MVSLSATQATFKVLSEFAPTTSLAEMRNLLHGVVGSSVADSAASELTSDWRAVFFFKFRCGTT